MRKKKNILKSEDKNSNKNVFDLENQKDKSEINGWKNKLKDKIFPHRTILINMELRNGMHITKLVMPSGFTFKFQGGTYIIDTDLKYYKASSKIYCLDYHQDFSLPIKREIPIKTIKSAVEHSGVCEVENSTNPSALTKILETKIGEGIANSSQIPDFIKQMRLLLIIGVVSSVAMLLLFMFKTGMLSSVKIPGM